MGGDGTDTLVTTAAVTVANAAGVSGIETLSIANSAAGGGITQDMDAFTVDTVTIGNVNNQAVTLSDAAAGDNYAFTAGITGTQTITLKTDTVADSTTISVGAAAAGITLTALSATDFETLTINSTGGANTITTLTAGDATSLTINATTALTITNAIGGTPALATIDARVDGGRYHLERERNRCTDHDWWCG